MSPPLTVGLPDGRGAAPEGLCLFRGCQTPAGPTSIELNVTPFGPLKGYVCGDHLHLVQAGVITGVTLEAAPKISPAAEPS